MSKYLWRIKELKAGYNPFTKSNAQIVKTELLPLFHQWLDAGFKIYEEKDTPEAEEEFHAVFNKISDVWEHWGDPPKVIDFKIEQMATVWEALLKAMTFRSLGDGES